MAGNLAVFDFWLVSLEILALCAPLINHADFWLVLLEIFTVFGFAGNVGSFWLLNHADFWLVLLEILAFLFFVWYRWNLFFFLAPLTTLIFG